LTPQADGGLRTAEANLSGDPARLQRWGKRKGHQGHPGPIAALAAIDHYGRLLQEISASVKATVAAINQELRLKPKMAEAS